MLSGRALTLAVLKSAMRAAWVSRAWDSRSTSVVKNSSVSPARPVRRRTFSCSTRFTSSFEPLSAISAVSAWKATPRMVAPGMPRIWVTSGMKPMNSIRVRMSPTMALADIGSGRFL